MIFQYFIHSPLFRHFMLTLNSSDEVNQIQWIFMLSLYFLVDGWQMAELLLKVKAVSNNEIRTFHSFEFEVYFEGFVWSDH